MKYERNFNIKELPNLDNWEKCVIKQWFITEGKYKNKIRYRLYDDGRFYIDSGEYSKKDDYNNFKFILERISYEEVNRFKYRFDSYFISIDLLKSSMIFEIESKDKSIVDNFKPYEWLGEEIKNHT